MRTLFCCVCLALCLSCSEALAPNQGTGKNCNTASDAPGGPKQQTPSGVSPLMRNSARAEPLSPFCCDEMDAPGRFQCYLLRTRRN
ncbi:hypothetical protein WJX82_010472 [Trebouxia sp. C0006]